MIAEELDGLVAQGVEYVYFIDEIFLPYRDVLEAIRDARHQVRHSDAHRSLERGDDSTCSANAGCVSIEAGVESITEAGRDLLDKKCKISTGRDHARV